MHANKQLVNSENWYFYVNVLLISRYAYLTLTSSSVHTELIVFDEATP